MSTLTVELPDEIASRLEAASRERHVAPAQLAVELIARSLRAAPGAAGLSAFDVMKDGFGCVESGVGDLSTNREHLADYGR